GIEMEQENIQERSVLSIDYHRPFIQVTAENIQERSVLSIDCHRPFIRVTAVSIEFPESSMPMR
nr:hypothetical protein [Tanacetum cinerariifolium]